MHQHVTQSSIHEGVLSFLLTYPEI